MKDDIKIIMRDEAGEIVKEIDIDLRNELNYKNTLNFTKDCKILFINYLSTQEAHLKKLEKW